ncbi:carbamoyltransferase HypF [Pseudomaricurvus alcaniphilus]|uniref:carbamoyltransferase HypF n=1 Tax=Pseudomaricurvus alcaniphilus TaxID=1166482 RepID=UPI00140B25C2|nr:carbamoyltransferase HypF [Pseudomaricurvus alcaniphilus]
MATSTRRRIEITGTVQGVGMRPFIYRLATELALAGWVANRAGGVVMEVQGGPDQVAQFTRQLQHALPPLAVIERLHCTEQPPHEQALHEQALPEQTLREQSLQGPTLHQQPGFTIRPSLDTGTPHLNVPTDRAPCPACLQEIRDPAARRYQYPFTSCTECGPRWSILTRLPFDRANTSLQGFALCHECAREYHNPGDRRFHAQTIACPNCGPSLQLLDRSGGCIGRAAEALAQTVAALRAGQVVALKAVGGMQLLVDASNPDAIARLRQRKQRPAKPLAVMFHSLEQVRHYCDPDRREVEALTSPARPIVLLRSRQRLPAGIAPAIHSLGAMLPSSALHQLLLDQFQQPLVATSGNPSGEPLCSDNRTALDRLGPIADLLLLHDLDITTRLDDSVVRVIAEQVVTLRAGRGLAPYLLQSAPAQEAGPMLALGGHLKSSVALSLPAGILASQHIGDLHSAGSQQHFHGTIASLQQRFEQRPQLLLRDAHPDYGSSHWCASSTLPELPVQHHVAHFFSCLAEHQHRGPALGVCWDGSGLGSDGSLWGGEFFHWDGGGKVTRIAHLRPFSLPGGEQAIREPRRAALALLYQMHGAQPSPPACLQAAFSPAEWRSLQVMLERGINSPTCSSAGRLIDGVAALLQLCYRNRYEAEAAMVLESRAAAAAVTDALPYTIAAAGECRVIDWQPTLEALLQQAQNGRPAAALAAAFHNTLADMIVGVAETYPELPVFVSGGVFQSRLLTEAVTARLRATGQPLFSHARVPPNDGGLAVGQLYYAQLNSAKPNSKQLSPVQPDTAACETGEHESAESRPPRLQSRPSKHKSTPPSCA